ncbi:hypothetical protein GIB67_012780, partial [Kingdonia uniflora]
MTMAFKHGTFVLIVAIFSIAQMVTAGDPNILSDFVVPSNVTQVDANLFTFTGMRVLVRAPIPPAFEVLKASLAEFPGLNGQSVSYAVLLFPSGTLNPPHTHPRSAELLYLLSGSLEVGFVDTEKKLYTQKIESGDMFVFPKGLVHYQYNGDSGAENVSRSKEDKVKKDK